MVLARKVSHCLWMEETALPRSSVPGAKIGLANIVTLIALMQLGTADAFAISLIRVFLTGILFGNTVMMVYSLAGAVLSVLVMSLLSRLKVFGTVGISIAGAVSHNIGQYLAAAVLMHTRSILWYLPLLVLYGVISGLITGFIASETMSRRATVESC